MLLRHSARLQNSRGRFIHRCRVCLPRSIYIDSTRTYTSQQCTTTGSTIDVPRASERLNRSTTFSSLAPSAKELHLFARLVVQVYVLRLTRWPEFSANAVGIYVIRNRGTRNGFFHAFSGFTVVHNNNIVIVLVCSTNVGTLSCSSSSLSFSSHSVFQIQLVLFSSFSLLLR